MQTLRGYIPCLEKLLCAFKLTVSSSVSSPEFYHLLTIITGYGEEAVSKATVFF